MVDPNTINLISDVVKLCSEVTHTFFSEDKTSCTNTIYNEKTTIIKERIFDKKAFENIVNKSVNKIELLLSQNTDYIVGVLKKQDIKNCVFEIQAQIKSLKTLLNIQDQYGNNSSVNINLVITALNPLQVSIEMAKLKLKDYNEEFLWRYCYITGTSSLISGYAYLGISMPNLESELKSEILNIKKEVLTELAHKYHLLSKEFPWENVNNYISDSDLDNLIKLYSNIEDQLDENREKSELLSLLSNPISDIKYTISTINNKRKLEFLLKAEKEGKYRFTLIEYIENLLDKL